MRYLLPWAIALATLTLPEAASAMSSYKWKLRPLVVFAENAASTSLAEQRRILAARRTGMIDRDVIVVWVVGDKVSAENGSQPRQSASALRSRFGASGTSFRVVLVGKDGGAKLSSATPMSATTLFGTIDAMPMRKDEMR